ncbi:MAG TPA: hypothetical protein VJT31_26420 [Rugosimonospora sp.]|nr:hypothetical protein [Rugosimonospora sp.]
MRVDVILARAGLVVALGAAGVGVGAAAAYAGNVARSGPLALRLSDPDSGGQLRVQPADDPDSGGQVRVRLVDDPDAGGQVRARVVLADVYLHDPRGSSDRMPA